MTFSEPIAAGSGSITVRYATNDTAVQSVAITDSTAVTIADTSVIVDLPDLLDHSTSYYVTVADIAIDDLTGRSYAGIDDEGPWSFRTDTEGRPTVTVGQPNGGEGLRGGQSYEIQWTATDDTAVAANGINISYSIDGGTTWTPIASGEANDGSYDWTVPAVDSELVLVRVRATDDGGNVGRDLSDRVFEVDSTIPEVVGARTADTNADGTVDRIQLTFSEAIDDASVSTGDVTVENGSVTGIDTGTSPNDPTVGLVVAGLTRNDTGILPATTVAQGSVGDLVGNAGPTRDSVPSQIDGAAPVMLSGSTTDVDGDGRLDQVRIDYSEPLDRDTANTLDYAVDGYSGLSVHSDDGDDRLVLGFIERSASDTATTPDVSYTRGTTADSAGNLAGDQALSPTLDGAAPAPTVSITDRTAGGFRLRVSLSEPGDANFVVLQSGAEPPTSAQVRAGVDAAGSPATASGELVVTGTDVTTSTTVSGLASGTTYDVYLTASDDPGNVYTPPLARGTSTLAPSTGGGGGGGGDGGFEPSRSVESRQIIVDGREAVRIAIQDVSPGARPTASLLDTSDPPITYRSFQMTVGDFGRERGTWRVYFEPGVRDRSVPELTGTRSLLTYYRLRIAGGTISMESIDAATSAVQLSFSVDPAVVPTGASLDDVEAYRYHEGAWTVLETYRRGDTITAVSPGMSTFAIAIADPPNRTVTPTNSPTQTPPPSPTPSARNETATRTEPRTSSPTSVSVTAAPTSRAPTVHQTTPAPGERGQPSGFLIVGIALLGLLLLFGALYYRNRH
jgi:hypothetical protein